MVKRCSNKLLRNEVAGAKNIIWLAFYQVYCEIRNTFLFVEGLLMPQISKREDTILSIRVR
jgi:hypothetical protein